MYFGCSYFLGVIFSRDDKLFSGCKFMSVNENSGISCLNSI